MKFSIITATYNSDRFLKKNIESVKNQTHKNWEHIFIDGFSSDQTKQIITNYKNEYPENVKLIEAQPKGISNAMNIGIEKASGDYLIHLHSDDSLFDKAVLEDVNIFLKNNNLDWIYGKINIVESNGKSVGIWPSKKIHQFNSKQKLGKQLIKYINFIPHQAVFIKPEVFKKHGLFDESLTTSMDSDLWLKIIDKTNWSFINLLVANYTVREDSQSANKNNKIKNKANYAKVQKRHLNQFEYLLGRLVENTINLFFNNYR